ncbi:pentapeptide repeat-containing protein [Flagellimonas onchidii]|uniref:pentapeptide repeat-containing protein n=1 Tax=Flagellimonas onchidii TaxID=2562684 RepID=UPI0010A5C6E9|nr:pentapeptide repeat-containing protein [Allomuricauda onchidii]
MSSKIERKLKARWKHQEVRIWLIVKTIKSGKGDWTKYLGKFEWKEKTFLPLSYVGDLKNPGANKNPQDLRGIELDNIDFDGANLTGVNFKYASLNDVNFTNCTIQGIASNFSNSHILSCKFENCNLMHAKIKKSIISLSSFKSANLYNVDLSNSTIRYSDLSDSNMIQANLKNVNFYLSPLRNVDIDFSTKFGLDYNWKVFQPKGKILLNEKIVRDKPKYFYDDEDEEFKDRSDEYNHTASVYRELKLSAKRKGLYELGGVFHFHEQKCLRKAFQSDKYSHTKFAWKLLNEIITGYGEKPFRTFLISLLVIFSFSFTFLFFGFNYFGEPEPRMVKRELALSLDELIPTFNDLALSFYMSTVTFTTLGYGDAHPIGLTKIFAGIEALLGIILISMFVVTISRVTIRD